MIISKPLSAITAFIKRLELKKCLIISVVVALLVSAIGYFTIASPVLDALGIRYNQWEYNPLSRDLLDAGFTICNGPPWLLLNSLHVSTPFDGYWSHNLWNGSMNWTVHLPFHEYYKWTDYFKIHSCPK